jgi:hypothetical protein
VDGAAEDADRVRFGLVELAALPFGAVFAGLIRLAEVFVEMTFRVVKLILLSNRHQKLWVCTCDPA